MHAIRYDIVSAKVPACRVPSVRRGPRPAKDSRLTMNYSLTAGAEKPVAGRASNPARRQPSRPLDTAEQFVYMALVSLVLAEFSQAHSLALLGLKDIE